LEGLRRLEPRLVAVIYSVDPAIASLVGLVGLSQDLSATQIVGIAAVMIASAGATATAGGGSSGVNPTALRQHASSAHREPPPSTL
jgi:threonine/homoserine efflux transporter RhtA